MINKKNIKIIGDRFVLLPFEMKHLTNGYLGWLRDDNINQFLLKPNNETSMEDATEFCKEMICSSNDIFLAIMIQKKHVGNVRIGPINYSSKVCQFSMMIGDKAYHGKGYGTEIVSSSIEYMFNILDMNKVTLDVLADNIPAVRIYAKNGMYEESISRESVFMNDKFYDVKTMSIINKNNIHP